jgi:hypothetical protein
MNENVNKHVNKQEKCLTNQYANKFLNVSVFSYFVADTTKEIDFLTRIYANEFRNISNHSMLMLFFNILKYELIIIVHILFSFLFLFSFFPSFIIMHVISFVNV